MAGTLDGFRGRKVAHERDWVRIEKCAVMGAFVIRKLIDSQKITDRVAASHISVRRYSYKSDFMSFWNSHHLDQHYNLGNEQAARLPLREFCNQVIHSYVLQFALTSRHYLAGLFVASDLQRRKSLYYVSAARIASALRRVAASEVTEIHSYRLNGTGDYSLILR